jgi:hypothetical protein
MKVLLYQFFINDNYITDKRNLENTQGYWELSRNSCKLYAEKNGWDYYLEYYDNKNSWTPSFFKDSFWFERFNAVKYLKDYDAVVYVDSDVLIKPSAQDIVKEYRKYNTNIVVNTSIGSKILNETSRNYTIGVNTGVMIWYNKSKNTNDLYNLKPKNYAWHENTFTLGEFIRKRQNLRWWENWEDFSDFTGRCKFGLRHSDMWLPFITSIYILPMSHLDEKYNYKFSPKKENDIMLDDIQFIHYEMNTKNYMEKHYNLIMP